MTTRAAAFRHVVTVAALCALAGCERDRRPYHQMPAASSPASSVRLTPLQPGEPQPPPDAKSPYHGNAWAMGEGKRLYAAFNCSGCHATNGGGGIGPALTDDEWIYGAQPAQIYSTIVQGRPDGMPSFGGRITDQQVWQLVAYVESLSGLVPKDAAPSRNDDIAAAKQESRRARATPKQTGHK